jgi:hypothetical protein
MTTAFSVGWRSRAHRAPSSPSILFLPSLIYSLRPVPPDGCSLAETYDMYELVRAFAIVDVIWLVVLGVKTPLLRV